MKPSSNFYTVVTVAMTLGALVYLYTTQPAIAPAAIVVIIPFIVGIVGALQQSKQNAEKLEANTVKTDQTHNLVNSQMEAFKEALRELAAMKVELASALSLAHGIAIGREQVVKDGVILASATGLISPADAAALGAAQAVQSAPADALPGEVADAAARGAADAAAPPSDTPQP